MSYGYRDLLAYGSRVLQARETFVAANPWAFLVRIPDKLPSKDSSQPDFHFSTYVPGADDVIDDEAHIVPAAQAPIVQPIRKRPDAPFPLRVSIGRTRNCDIVMRFKTVSKLHAQFHLDQPQWTLVVVESTNGTFLNEERLQARKAYKLSLGDKVRFGRVDTELVDAGTLYDRLQALRS